MNASPCRQCRQRPAALPDGRCLPCAQAQAQAQTQPGLPHVAPPAPGPAPAAPAPPAAAAPPPFPGQGAPPHPGPYPGPAYPGPYPGPPAPPAFFSSPQALSTALVVLCAVNMAVLLLSFAATVGELDVVHDLQAGGWNVTYEEAEDADDRFLGAYLLRLLVLIATGVVFLVWFHRTRVNAEVFAPAGHRMSRGWSIGGWFTPVVNLWFPKRIANDIWRASTPWGRHPGLGLVTGWWVLWLCFSLTQGAGLSGTDELSTEVDGYDDLDRLEVALSIELVSALLGVVAALLALLYVRALTARQLTKYHQGPVPPPAAWPPNPAPAGPYYPGGRPGAFPGPFPGPQPPTGPPPGP
ncbi:DUF4328 domain-containing protein [Streptomyces hoynatensis]|uniref:DUF4328 domain-containing protein n=1 Tax=Streptomyces hoynatensis TaxID=1141874 RepID=A0A3A9ZB51_9ACTN|nr:DUF4328 domain-containing protein [Streptomyces hoynatensis]RKN45692.1 DUF4328 domain-containing protein [Streptomyces hoynatensis]